VITEGAWSQWNKRAAEHKGAGEGAELLANAGNVVRGGVCEEVL